MFKAACVGEKNMEVSNHLGLPKDLTTETTKITKKTLSKISGGNDKTV
jgi:bacteriocin-like protein